MKISINNYLVVTFLALFSYLFYPLPDEKALNADIKNSHHDFSDASWANFETCKPCHVPHNSVTEGGSAVTPLWSHTLSTATYSVYTSSTLNSLPGQPSGTSKLCLSCHDGTVATSDHVGTTDPNAWTLQAFGNLGTNLTGMHPISIRYDAALANADGGLHDPTSTASGLGSTISEDLLENGNMECSSCHDPHISRNTQGCSGCHFVNGMSTRTLSIRIDNSGSALCLTCHDK